MRFPPWRTGIVLFAVAVAFAAPARAAASAAVAVEQLRGALILNEDNSHFFSSRAPADMTLTGVQAFVDGYAGTKVTHLFLSPNAMRASFRSRTREAIWDPAGGVEPSGRWPENAKRLHEAGIDPYAVWIQHSRLQGISPWLSMRMNDVHDVNDPTHFMHSEFWRTHPELRRAPDGPPVPWVNRALNYAHAAVREHNLAFARELLERYDPDGLELDWMRFGHHLTPGREREEGKILEAFVREIRALTAQHAARRGHPILLGVRVPAHPDAAAGLGMDAVRWAHEGLVDLVVPGPFFSTTDFDIPLELWRERLGTDLTRVVLAPAVEHNARAWPAGKTAANDLAALRGFAASGWARGADSQYLFNWMDSETRPVNAEDYRELLRTGLARESLIRTPRRHLVTYRDTVPAGFSNGTQLPIEAPAGGSFRLNVGPRTTTGKSWIVAGLAARDNVSESRITATCNGRGTGPAEELKNLTGIAGAARALRFACPPDALRDGENTFTLRQTDDGTPQQIVWAEIRIEP